MPEMSSYAGYTCVARGMELWGREMTPREQANTLCRSIVDDLKRWFDARNCSGNLEQMLTACGRPV